MSIEYFLNLDCLNFCVHWVSHNYVFVISESDTKRSQEVPKSKDLLEFDKKVLPTSEYRLIIVNSLPWIISHAP